MLIASSTVSVLTVCLRGSRTNGISAIVPSEVASVVEVLAVASGVTASAVGEG